jgi:hypothetical protein
MSDPYRGRGGGGRARLGGGGRGFVEGNRYNVLREDSGEQNTSTPRSVVNTGRVRGRREPWMRDHLEAMIR